MFIGPTLEGGYDSFPSGHVTVVFCFIYIFSQHFPRYRVIFYMFAVIVGFERVEDYSHFLSDVFAGAVVGLILGKFLLKMFNSKQLALMPEITPQSSYRNNNQ
jgi:undecaprenyl-diphosphatase